MRTISATGDRNGFGAFSVAFMNRIIAGTRLNVTTDEMCAALQGAGFARDVLELTPEPCVRAESPGRRVGEIKVKLKDLQATAAIVLLLMSGSTQQTLAQAAAAPSAPAQQTNPTAPVAQTPTGADQSNLPSVPEPKLTEPLYLRPTAKDYAAPWVTAKSIQPLQAHGLRGSETRQHAASGYAGAGWKDLSQPLRCGFAGSGE